MGKLSIVFLSNSNFELNMCNIFFFDSVLSTYDFNVLKYK
jgi:hypothetical protein